MTHPVVARRRRQRQELIHTAALWAAAMPDALEVVAVVVIGSVARGDFNKWSDLDVLVVAERLPEPSADRMGALATAAPPGLQAVGWTPSELRQRLAARDPIAAEAYGVGVVVRGRLPPG
jgi:predicted nucleotidyltransferase